MQGHSYCKHLWMMHHGFAVVAFLSRKSAKALTAFKRY